MIKWLRRTWKIIGPVGNFPLRNVIQQLGLAMSVTSSIKSKQSKLCFSKNGARFKLDPVWIMSGKKKMPREDIFSFFSFSPQMPRIREDVFFLRWISWRAGWWLREKTDFHKIAIFFTLPLLFSLKNTLGILPWCYPPCWYWHHFP